MLSNVILVTNITHFKELVDRAAYILNEGSTKDIILDFSDMDYPPSSIVGAVISIADKVKSLGGKLALRNVGPEMIEQFASLNIPIDTITPDVDLS